MKGERTMSKGSSGLFSGTSGDGKALIDEVISNGDKISPDKVLLIGRDQAGKIVWIEEGNDSSGFQHILDEHGNDFNNIGISEDKIPEFVMEAVSQGTIVDYQGKRNPRPIYEFEYNGETYRVAVQVGSNGYIVGANPKSLKE